MTPLGDGEGLRMSPPVWDGEGRRDPPLDGAQEGPHGLTQADDVAAGEAVPEEEGDLEWLLGPPAGTAAYAAEAERRAYVSRRLRRLHERVFDRVEALQASEIASEDQLRALRGTLRRARAEQAWPFFELGPAQFAQQQRAIRGMERDAARLKEEAEAFGDALGVAVLRLDELQRGGKMLRLGGTRAVRDALARREFSPPLEDFLQKLMH
jgi:hypothetical protein